MKRLIGRFEKLSLAMLQKRNIAHRKRTKEVFRPGKVVNGVVKGNIEDADVIGACKAVVITIGRHLLFRDMPRPDFGQNFRI